MDDRFKQQEKQAALKKEEMEKNFWKYAGTRIENILDKIMILHQMPGFTKERIDLLELEFSNFLDIVNSNTLPEVIAELTRRELKAIALKKLES